MYAVGGGNYAKLEEEKSAMGTKVLCGLRARGGLTCDFWAVFEGGLGDLFFEGFGTMGVSPNPTHDDDRRGWVTRQISPMRFALVDMTEWVGGRSRFLRCAAE